MNKVNNLFKRNRIRIFFLLIILGIIVIYNLYFDKKIIEGNTKKESKIEKEFKLLSKKLEDKLSNIDIIKGIDINILIELDFYNLNEINSSSPKTKEFIKLIIIKKILNFYEMVNMFIKDSKSKKSLNLLWDNIKNSLMYTEIREITVNYYLNKSHEIAYDIEKIKMDYIKNNYENNNLDEELSDESDINKISKEIIEDKKKINEKIENNEFSKISESNKKTIKKMLINLNMKKIDITIKRYIKNRYLNEKEKNNK